MNKIPALRIKGEGVETEEHADYIVTPPIKSMQESHEDYVIEQALEILKRRLGENPKGEAMTSPDLTRKYLRLKLAERRNEVFCLMLLDTRHRLIDFVELVEGTIDQTPIHPRVVVEHVFHTNAAAVVLAHNHPSGVAEPSSADLAVTRRLRDALQLIDVRLLDHFIVGEAEVVSLAERGLV